jgi:hypothetical protein
VYWKPIYAILEGALEIVVANAQHIKKVPGCKTDVKDAEWIANLLCHGLLRSSFVPPKPIREFRDLMPIGINWCRVKRGAEPFAESYWKPPTSTDVANSDRRESDSPRNGRTGQRASTQSATRAIGEIIKLGISAQHRTVFLDRQTCG